MPLIETEALVLKSYSLAEADKIVVFLTQTDGLVRGVARGAKRLKSRFGSSFEPFTILNLTVFQKEERELVSIREIELVKTFFEFASDPPALQKIAYLSELLTEFAPPHEPNERLYRMSKICIETAAEIPGSFEAVVMYFEVWILRLGGYLPDWSRCERCKIALQKNEPANLLSNFHLACRRCQKSRPEMEVSGTERELFLAAQKLAPVKFVELAPPFEKEIREISHTLKRLIAGVLGKDKVGEKTFMAGLA